jgi:lipid-binding SYLF domain-containing protein
MMRISTTLLTALLAVSTATAWADTREEARLLNAKAVLTEWQQMPDQSIPQRLLDRAQAIVVFPSVVKAALVFGGRGGKGAAVVRDANGRWSDPVFVMLGGGSWGFQFGVETADVILVFTTRRGVEGIAGGKLTLGGDMSGAIGPVGREMSGSTDIGLAEVYSYSRAKGLFGGVAIDGTVMTIDHSANDSFYQHPGLLASDIFNGKGPQPPASGQQFVAAVTQLTSGAKTAAAPAAAAPPAPAPTSAKADGPGLESGGAATFPLEKPKP